MHITTLFCEVDDFCINFDKNRSGFKLENLETKVRNRKTGLSHSEMMTILILFHSSGYRNFKDFYKNFVSCHFIKYFPGLLSYTRFIELMPRVLVLLCTFLKSKMDEPTGIAFIDSTKLEVCHKKRMNRNKVFAGIGKKTKSTMGWFFGFKLHLVINEKGGILGVKVTAANTDDRAPVKDLTKNLKGLLFGDKGYISIELFNELFSRGLKLVTSVRKNMKNKLMILKEKILLRKRSIIETVNDQLKNISQIEHTRHRSITNFMINILCGLIAYTFKEKKPSISGFEHLLQNEVLLIN